MTRSKLATILSAILLWVTTVLSLLAQVSVTTYHNDNARTGQNTNETILTPAAVQGSSFGQLFQLPVDGQVYAQPLILANVAIGGGTHNVVYVATEHDSLYAFDADSGTQYWQKSLISPPAVKTATNAQIGCGNISKEYGITSTPVIDSSTNTIYVVAQTVESGVFMYRLHALDVETGAEKFGGPVAIAGSYGGIVFTPKQQMNRAGLLLENGHIILGWGSHCDHPTYYGWVMSYNATTLAQEAIYNDNVAGTSGQNAGIWMAGGGVAADANGNLFLATGNGDYGPVSQPVDFGDSILKLSPPSNGTFAVADWFTPHDQQTFAKSDGDLGSGGVMLLPDQPPGYTHQQLLVQMGKKGKLYLVDRNNMGHYCSGCKKDTNIVQEIVGATFGVWGSPAYWNGNVYYGNANDSRGVGPVEAFSLYSTVPYLELTSQTPETFSYSTPTPSVSSNGNSGGILWVLDNGSFRSHGPTVLHAYDATNLATELYNGDNHPDQAGPAVKFSVPTVANGKVYVGSQNSLTVYGISAGVSSRARKTPVRRASRRAPSTKPHCHGSTCG
ncbi:MAG: PQQ-binding-like beta-propeller repeat protein [Terriglobales bacterium]